MKIKSLRLLYLAMFLPVFTFNIPEANAAPACGSGKNAYLLSVGSPVGSRQFAVACIEHDACYDILGKSKGECDKAFHNRMLGICSRDHNTWFGRPLRIACNGRADAFYSAVRAGGGTAYSTAQDDARKELPSAPALAASNYQTFRLQTGTALHQTGGEFAFGVLPNGDVVAIKKSGTGSGKTEVHILSLQ
jgi:Group XII secretory phospholipase A2 precursor (PLA2G12)